MDVEIQKTGNSSHFTQHIVGNALVKFLIRARKSHYTIGMLKYS